MSPLHTVGAGFDERRNTSRVFASDPLNTDAGLRESARLRKRAPKLVEWLKAGALPIRSVEEHLDWFGVPYKRGELT